MAAFAGAFAPGLVAGGFLRSDAPKPGIAVVLGVTLLLAAVLAAGAPFVEGRKPQRLLLWTSAVIQLVTGLLLLLALIGPTLIVGAIVTGVAAIWTDGRALRAR